MQISNISSAVAFLRTSPTIEDAITSFAQRNSVQSDQSLEEFANGILQAQQTLSKTDFSKLVQLETKVVRQAPNKAKAIYKLCIDLLMQENQPAEISEVSQKIDTLTANEVSLQNQCRVLHYLDMLTSPLRSFPEMINGSLNLARLTDVQHQYLLGKFERATDMQKGYMLITFSTVSAEECAQIIDTTFPIIDADGESQEEILFAIAATPQTERQEIIAILTSTFKEVTDNYQKALLIHTLKKIPRETRKEAIDLAFSIYPGAPEHYDITDALTLVGHLSKENLTPDFAKMTMNFLSHVFGEEIPSDEESEKILRTIGNLPREESIALMEMISAEFSAATYSSAIRVDILKAALLIPKISLTAKLVQQIALLIHDLEDGEARSTMISRLSQINAIKRATYITITSPILSTVQDGFVRADILRCGTFLPQASWNAHLFKRLVVLFSYLNKVDRYFVQFALSCIDEADYVICCDLLLTGLQQHQIEPRNALPFLLSCGEDHQKRRDRIYAKYFKHLSSTDQDYAGKAAAIVIKYSSLLLLHQEHPLYRKAIEVYSVTSGDSLSDPKNPFNVYQKLKTLETTPIDYIPPEEQVCGEMVRFNLAALEKLAKENTLEIPFSQLPTDVSLDTLKLLFDQIDQRLTTLHPTLSSEKLTQLQESLTYEYAYPILKANFLEGEIPTLLSIRGAPHDLVPIGAAKLFAIVHFILKQSNERLNGQFLSPREETLLKMSSSIQHCEAAKHEGIALAYHRLPEEDQLYGKQSEKAEVEVAGNALHQEIQNILLPLFSSDNAFMKEITNTPSDKEIVQLSHQSIYAKNIIGSRMGLEHAIRFDLPSRLISDHLFGQDIPALLSTGFKHFTPSIAVKSVAKGISKRYKALQEKDAASSQNPSKSPAKSQARPLFNQLNKFAEKGALENCDQAWKFDEESYEVTECTEEGALSFLKGAGYLEPKTKSLKRSHSSMSQQ